MPQLTPVILKEGGSGLLKIDPHPYVVAPGFCLSLEASWPWDRVKIRQRKLGNRAEQGARPHRQSQSFFSTLSLTALLEKSSSTRSSAVSLSWKPSRGLRQSLV